MKTTRTQKLIAAALFAVAALTASAAQAKGWTVVSMQHDWKIVFPAQSK